MKERIYMASPTMHGEEQKFVQEAFDTNWIAPLGPNVNGFEREMEAYTGIAHCSRKKRLSRMIMIFLLINIKRSSIFR